MTEKIVGQVKWFGSDRTDDRRKSYGFINVIDGPMKDQDVFVHQSAIKPCVSSFRTLRRGEFVEFELVEGQDGRRHAQNVTGVRGYPLMCDIYHMQQQQRQPPSQSSQVVSSE